MQLEGLILNDRIKVVAGLTQESCLFIVFIFINGFVLYQHLHKKGAVSCQLDLLNKNGYNFSISSRIKKRKTRILNERKKQGEN